MRSYLLSIIGWSIINLLGKTLRITRVNEEAWKNEKNVVFGFWHGEQFIPFYCHRDQQAVVMSSLSKDGEVQAGILKKFGYQAVRGSSSRGGDRALIELIRLVRKGFSAGFAVDGPRGPFHEIKPGAVYAALKSGCSFVPISAAVKWRAEFSKAWDKYELPMPFAPGVIAYGKAQKIDKNKSIEENILGIRDSMEAWSTFAHVYYWSDDIHEYLEHHPYPKIMIIQPSRIGDVIFSLPTVAALRKKYPHAWIGWIIDERCADIIKNNPDINEVIIVDRSKITVRYLAEMRKRLRGKNIDVSIDLHGLFKSALFAGLIGAKFRLGSASTNGMKELSWLFSKEIKPKDDVSHCVDRHLEVAYHLGCPIETHRKFTIAISDDAAVRVEYLLTKNAVDLQKPIIILFPGGGWISRRWFPERFAQLADRIIKELNAEVVLIGGKEGGAAESGLNEMVLEKTSAGVKDLTGMLSLNELAALMKRSALFVGNEAGPMHLAMALQVPSVVLIGPTDPRRTGPYGESATIVRHTVDCQPCRERNCKKKICMERIGVAEVFEAVKMKLLKEYHENSHH